MSDKVKAGLVGDNSIYRERRWNESCGGSRGEGWG